MHEVTHDLMPVGQAARLLRLPAAWLRERVERGELPGLVAGNRPLVHLPTIEAILVEQASAKPSKSASAQSGEVRRGG